MNRNSWFILILVLIVGAVLLFVPFSSQDNYKQSSIITLNERAEMKFDPDHVKIFLGVQTEGTELESLLDQGSERVKQVQEKLDELSNLTYNTIDYQIVPIREKDMAPNNINGEEDMKVSYRVRHMIEITSSNPQATGEIIGKAIKSGANFVTRVEYQLQDKNEARDIVIEKALQELSDKVEVINGKYEYDNYELESLDLNDNFISRSVPYNLTTEDYHGPTPPPISPGQITINVNVRGKYKFYKK